MMMGGGGRDGRKVIMMEMMSNVEKRSFLRLNIIGWDVFMVVYLGVLCLI